MSYTRICPLPHLVLAVLLLLGAVLAYAGECLEAGLDYRETVLANGLRVVTLEDFSTPVVAVQMWYHVGSKNEDPWRQGFAHMFEHMMFRETEVLGPEDFSNIVDGVGGSNNAFTYFDYTAYVTRVPSCQLDLALWLEAERMVFLKVTEEGFEKERGVVEEERRQLNLDTPYGTVPERIMPIVFTKHPYRWLPIGRIPHLRAANTDELRAFWDRHYVPASATLVIAGAVTHDDALGMAREFFDWVPAMPGPPEVDVVEPEQVSKREVTIKERLGPIPLAVHVYRGLPVDHPDSMSLQMAVDILAGGESSRMYRDLVKERKLCVMLLSQDFSLEQDGLTGFAGAVHPVHWILGKLNPFDGGPCQAVFDAFDRHIESFRRDGPTPREVEKAKNRMLANALAEQLRVTGKAQALGEAGIMHGTPDWVNRRAAAIQGITAEDIRRAAGKFLVPERLTEAKVLPSKRAKYDPDGGEDPAYHKVSTETTNKIGIERPERFSSTPPVKPVVTDIPESRTEERVLSNGLKVVVIPDKETPMAFAVLGLRYGACSEDATRPGVASMTLEMLSKGTSRHSAEEIADIVDWNALWFEGEAGHDESHIMAGGLSSKLDAAIGLLAEVVLEPTFPESELRLLKRQRRAMLSYMEKDPAYRASDQLKSRMFGSHPYARPVSGCKRDVRGIKREHLADWWARFARPDAAVLYIAGDVEPEDALALASDTFGSWRGEGPLPEVRLSAMPGREPTRIYLVDNPGAAQSHIRVGQTATLCDDPDYHKAAVVDMIFGGAFGSRLNNALRVEKGLTYGAGGGFSIKRFGASFAAGTSTQTASTAEALRAMLAVIEGMSGKTPSDEELNRARMHLIGKTPADYETPLDVAEAKWFVEYNGLPEDNLQRALEEYDLTKAEDVIRISSEHIDSDALTVVVVGDAKAIQDGLKSIAEVTRVR